MFKIPLERIRAAANFLFYFSCGSRGIKSRYLYHKEVKNGKQLFKEISLYYKEYNEVKPHYAHKIYTPDEVYKGEAVSVNYKERSAQAGRKRREINKNNGCGRCNG